MNIKIYEILKGVLSIILSIIVSLAFTIGILMILSKDKTIEKKANEIIKVKEEKYLDYNQILLDQEKKLKCLSAVDIKDKRDCFKIKDKNSKVEMLSKKNETILFNKFGQPFSKLNSRDPFIFLSYILIMLLISIQTFIFLTILLQNKNSSIYHFIQKYKFTLGELCLNAPMTIGLLGSIYAYSIGMDSSTVSGIIEAFKKIIFDGVGTTLLGGLAYVYTLTLNIYIQK